MAPANSLTQNSFRLNGRSVSLPGADPNRTLLEALRDVGLTGAKEGCNEGDCGACTVAIALPDADGTPCWRSVNACILPLGSVAGREIRTIEGLAAGGAEATPGPARSCPTPDSLHPIQAAMLRHHGAQCGYCTPGIVLSLLEACHRRDLTTEEGLAEQLAGNLCRCTGYRPIRAAALAALEAARRGEGLVPAPSTTPAIAPDVSDGVRSFHPRDLASFFRLQAQFPAARLIAGGTDLGPEITRKFHRFEALLSLEHVRELTELRATADAWHLGAAVPLTVLAERLDGAYPELDAMLRGFGSRQIRNRATLGGNLVTASPVACAATLLLAMDAQLVLADASGERVIRIEDFFTGYRKTALRPGEILRTLVLGRTEGSRRSFRKVSRRPDVDIATVSMACAVKLDGANRVTAVRIACGGVAATPARARRAEAVLQGHPWDAARIEAACRELEAEFTPITDVRGSAAYRRRVLRGLLESFFENDGPEATCTPLARASNASSEPGAHPEPVSPLPSAGVSSPPPEGRRPTSSRCTPVPVQGAHLHVTGSARFVDDSSRGMLEAWPVLSPHAHARIVRTDASIALRLEGVEAVLFASDIPGLNDVGAVRNDEPLLAKDKVFHHGQPVALVVARTLAQARQAAAAVEVEYQVFPALIDFREAIAAGSFHTPPNTIRRGDLASALATAPHRITGEFGMGGQDHFYLETHAAWAEPGDDGSLMVNSSTQHPSGIQAIVAQVLELPMNHVTVQCPRLGGGFGGKETQAATPAALAALAASRTGKPVRVRYSREQDMVITGKRHPFLAHFEVGFDDTGRIRAARIELFADAGCSLDLSRSIVDRALLHLDNAYFLPAVEFAGTPVKTHTVSNTAFRGFGGPQGMLVIEEILDRVARRLGLRPEQVRERNLYRGSGETATTHYGQAVPTDRLARVWEELRKSSDFDDRRNALEHWNREHLHKKRGIAITPVKFGIAFTQTFLNQAGALVLIHRDGTVEVNHGGTEMGQGLTANIARIAATALDLPADRIRVMPTRTDKVPNASATAASCSTDLNGMAVQQACAILADRLAPYRIEGRTFAEAMDEAWRARVSLSSLGHYQTPGLSMDWSAGRGNPFHYFAVGAAVSEVEIDGRTGMTRVLRVDVLHDVGNAIHPEICRGQVEGGFVQGMGWLTTEELVWDANGQLLTRSPDTYKIPTYADVPRDFRVDLLSNAAQPGTIHGSKAVGEPPFMLAISVREAIRDAVAAFGGVNPELVVPDVGPLPSAGVSSPPPEGRRPPSRTDSRGTPFGGSGEIALASPATAEAILRAIPVPLRSHPHA